jgi:hypothetical protein
MWRAIRVARQLAHTDFVATVADSNGFPTVQQGHDLGHASSDVDNRAVGVATAVVGRADPVDGDDVRPIGRASG